MQRSYILKFDEIKGDYVIVDQPKNSQRFPIFSTFRNGFFKRKDEKILENGLKTLENSQNNQNFNENTPQNVNQTPQESPSPSPQTRVDDSLPLIADLYNRFRILDMIYQNLRAINTEFSQIFGDFSSINRDLQSSLLNIYHSVGSENNSPQQNLASPALPSGANEIFKIVADYLQEMREINYQLLNLFQSQPIERQLNLIDTALSIQADKVTNLRLL